MNRLRAGAAIAASVILSVMMLASCQTTGGGRSRSGDAIMDQPVSDRLRQTIASFVNEPERCQEILNYSGVRVSRVADEAPQRGCGLSGAVKYQGVDYKFTDMTRVSCPMASALAVWERQIVAPAAARYLRSPVVKVDIMGSYACRTRNSKPGAPMSEHATGNAADIGGFQLRDGTKIVVEQDWRKGSAEAEFLHEVRTKSCDLFNAVLSPDYNYAHRNHLHFDLGRDRLCR
ncbi:MAG: extensin family protein [Caulobacterales bacterium]